MYCTMKCQWKQNFHVLYHEPINESESESEFLTLNFPNFSEPLDYYMAPLWFVLIKDQSSCDIYGLYEFLPLFCKSRSNVPVLSYFILKSVHDTCTNVCIRRRIKL